MARRAFAVLLMACVCASAVIIDRISIVVNDWMIKHSDIIRNIRITAFLNREPLDLSVTKQKEEANRLIDQIFMRREIDVGGYPTATLPEADQQLARLKKQRFRTDAAYQEALSRYGLTELDLRMGFQWQLTVLRFIDVRFKPGAIVTDDDVEKYFHEHAAALKKAEPGKSTLDDFRPEIENTLSGEKVNQQFFAWLEEKRKEARIRYHEESLR